MLSLGQYLAGVAGLSAIAVALGFGAWRVRARLMPGWSGAPARLAEIVFALAALLLISELLGALGAFAAWPVIAATVATGLVSGAVAGRPRRAAEPTPPGRRRSEPAGPALGGLGQPALAIAASAAAFAIWTIPTLESLDRGMYGFDTQWYHMPFSARFATTGGIWDFHHTTPVLLSWFYPASSELLHGVGILLFDRDILSPLVNLGWLAVALLAAWCIGRPWRVGGLTVIGAFVVLAAGIFGDQAGEARNDVMALAAILAAAALLVNRRSATTGATVAAGLAAGIAVGTRLTSLAPVAALIVGAVAVTRRGERLRAAAIWLAATALTGGFWYLRNLLGAGNPLPPVGSIGPLELPGPDQELGGRPSFSVAHYATDFGVWSDWFAPALADALGPLWPVVLALAAAGAILAVVRGPTATVRVLGAVAIVTAVAYVFTPVTASGPEGQPLGFGPNLRYLAPGLALALALLPVSLTGLDRRWLLAGGGALGAVALSIALRPERWDDGHLAAGLIVGGLVAATALIAVAAARHRGGRLALAAVGATGALVVAGAVAAGYFEQREYLRERYANAGEVLPNPGLDTLFRWGREVRDSRIGTTVTRQYPLYGTDLSNHVQFVGIEGPEASFTRATGCEQWREAVNEGDYDFLVTGLDRIEPGGPRRPRERAWTLGSEAAREIVRDGPVSVFAIDGRLDPERCA